ncbi:MAG: hypothetical protein K5894_14180, partial [Lachnospiraceae bacterium]|nr:hypothetical protein [Lachnospiraceae bacterium]
MEKQEEVDDLDFVVIDKGRADYNFYSADVYPSEEKGYMTLKLTYEIKCSPRVTGLTSRETVSVINDLNRLVPYDYYSGEVINTDITNFTEDVRESDPVDTKIDYKGQKIKLTAWYSVTQINGFENVRYLDNGEHFEGNYNFYELISLYVSYPEKYDGLSFALKKSGVSDHDLILAGSFLSLSPKEISKEILSEIFGRDNQADNIEILDLYEEGADDWLFYTMKTEESVKTERVSSEEDTFIPD